MSRLVAIGDWLDSIGYFHEGPPEGWSGLTEYHGPCWYFRVNDWQGEGPWFVERKLDEADFGRLVVQILGVDRQKEQPMFRNVYYTGYHIFLEE